MKVLTNASWEFQFSRKDKQTSFTSRFPKAHSEHLQDFINQTDACEKKKKKKVFYNIYIVVLCKNHISHGTVNAVR